MTYIDFLEAGDRLSEEPVKMNTNIRRFSRAEKIAQLTHRYLELKLPLQAALLAAEADLEHFESRTGPQQ
jgi:hypothetical protein